MILCYLYDVTSRKYRNEQYNIENFGVLMCLLSILTCGIVAITSDHK